MYRGLKNYRELVAMTNISFYFEPNVLSIFIAVPFLAYKNMYQITCTEHIAP